MIKKSNKNNVHPAKSVLLLVVMAVSLFIFSTCVYENLVSPDAKEAEIPVTLSLKAPATTRSRSLNSAQEESVKNIQVLAFKTDGTFAYSSTSSTTTDSGTTFTVTLRKGTWNLVVLANASELLTNVSTGMSQNTVLANLEKSITAGTGWSTADAQINGLVMCSEVRSNVSIDDNTPPITGITLYRMIAKVDVAVAAATQSKFKLASIRVYNYETAGKVYPTISGGKPIFVAPATSAKIKGYASGELIYDQSSYQWDTAEGISDVRCTNVIYLNPVAAGSKATFNTNTCLVVGGIYAGDQEVTYYRVDFSMNDGSYIDLIRNHKYQININRVSGSGEPTANDAFDHEPVNMEVEVVDWDEGHIMDIAVQSQYGLGVNNKSFTFYADAVSGTGIDDDNLLIISTNYDENWTISAVCLTGGEGWLTVNRASDGATGSTLTCAGSSSTSAILTENFHLQLAANNTNSDRFGTVTAMAGNLTQTITVVQKSTPSHTLEVSPVSLNFGSAAGNKTFAIMSNTEWAVTVNNEATGWCTINTLSGSGDNGGVSVSVTPNAGEPRTATLTVVSTSGVPVRVRTITVTQEGQQPSLSASPTLINLNGGGVQQTVTVTSNSAWSVSSDKSWCVVSPDSGSGDHIFYVSANANNSGATRTATITIATTGSNSITKTVSVTQPAYVSGGEADLLYFAEDGTLQVGRLGTDFSRSDMAFFKFGSVVGFTNNGEAWKNAFIRFNPMSNQSAITEYGVSTTIPGIPCYNGESSLLNKDGFISSSEYHTGTNVLNGKGDPCKLAGKTANEIRAMGTVGINSYNSGWRLPTSIENVDFVAASILNYGLLTAISQSSVNFNYWGKIPNDFPSTGIASSGGWFPVPGDRTFNFIRSKRNTDTSGFLSTTGYRSVDGASNDNTVSGNYWSSTPLFLDNKGVALNFSSSKVFPRIGLEFNEGTAVRCVRQ